MLELVAILIAVSRRTRTRPRTVVEPRAPSFVLPAIADPPRPPRRLARGSIAHPATSVAGDVPRGRPLIRPSHARR